MSSTTNIAVNSRSMNSVIIISDGVATLENGDLDCQDINSNSLTTDNINTNLLSVSGEFRCNLNGPLSIPISISSLTGLLISYGNVSNSGATDFTNFGSTYTSTQQGFRFFNKSNTQTLTNLAIIDNSQTYFKSQLVGCTAESPLNTTSIVNKSYVDNNFVDRTNNLTQSINGLKTFTNNCNFTSIALLKSKKQLNTTQNIQPVTSITLSFPLPETNVIRSTGATTITVILPTVTANEVGLLFNFFKFQNGLNVIFQSSSRIFTLNDLGNGPTTNTTLLSSDKIMTTLMCGSFGTIYYWVEVNTYSTFDRDYNNTIYPRLSVANTFTNTNTFNSQMTLKNKLSFVDNLTPFTKQTDTYQSGSVLTNEQNFNLGQYQFKTRTSTGSTNTPLRIDNDGISVFGVSSCAVMEASAYRGTSASDDIAFGGTTTSGKILIGSVINGTLGGEIRIGTTLSTNNINGTTTFQKLPLCSEVVSSASQLVNKTFTDLTYQTIAGMSSYLTISIASSTYQTIAGMSSYLTTAIASSTYIDFTTDQTISGTKRFNTLAWTNNGNVFASSITGTYLNFSSFFNLNNYAFYTRDALSQSSISFQISSSATTINNSLVSNAQATFNNNCPISNINASSNNHLTTLGFNDGRYVDKVNNQAISGDKTFNGASTLNGTLSANAEVYCNTWLNLKFRTRVYDLNGLGNYTQMYMIGGNEFVIGPNANGDKISFYCKDSSGTGTNTFFSSSLSNTSNAPFICNALATFNANISGQRATFRSSIANYGAVDFNATGAVDNRISFIPYSDGTMGFQNIFQNKDCGFLFFSEQVIDRGGFCIAPWNSGSAGIRISPANVSIPGPLVTGGQASFNTYAPISNTSPTLPSHLVRKDYVDAIFTSNNTYTGTNLFVGDLIAKSNIKLYDPTSSTRYSNFYMYLNEFIFTTINGINTALSFSLNDNIGNQYEAMRITNNLITFATSNIFLSNTGDTIIDSASTTGVSLFDTITGGVVSMFSSLSNSIVTMFNSSTNDVTLEINAKVKFRQVKLYNQVKTITSNITLDFPLEETIVIRPTGVMFIELPLITANSLGMSFNFITNSTAYAIWFSTQGTDNIIKNGYTTGNSSQIILGSIGITSVQMTCLELSAGVYTWSFFSSLPERVSNPPGTIITMCVQSTPNGYLSCNGGSYSFGGIYSNLYQVIGTTYGSSGVGTFKVPNFNNGSFLRGVTGNAGAIGTQQQDNIRTHTHNTTFYRFDKGSSGGTNVISDLSTGSLGSTIVTSATNTAGSPDETRPINYAVYYCIKY